MACFVHRRLLVTSPPMPSPTKLQIDGLSWETDEVALRHAFAAFGSLESVVVLLDPHSGRPMGCGSVTFSHPPHATAALAEMAHAVIDGSTIRITRAPSDSATNG